MWNLFILSLLPLICFAIINYYTNLKVSVVSSIFTAFCLLIASWVIFDWFDFELVTMIVLMIIFGIIAIVKNNEFYFKLQPAVSGFAVCLIIIYFELFDQSLLFKFLPKIKAVLPHENIALLENALVLDRFHTLFLHGCFWISVHSALLAWAARFGSTKTWLLVKAFFLPTFLVILMITMYFIA